MGSPFRYKNFQMQSGLRWKKWHRPVVSVPGVRLPRNYMTRCHLRTINFGWSGSGGFSNRFRSSTRRGRRLTVRTTGRITFGCKSFLLIRFFVTYLAFNPLVYFSSEYSSACRINRGNGRKVYKDIVKRGIKVHRSVLTRIEASDNEHAYVPQIRPNIKVRGQEEKVCRRMTQEEWMKGTVEGADLAKPWLEWVGEPPEDTSV
jgi:hypothetical protein